MAATIRGVEYFYLTVRDRPGESYRLLSQMASLGVDLLAFSAVPMGGETTQLTLFPAQADRLRAAAESGGLALSGPQFAFLIQGDDELGALLGIHRKLAEAQINVFASSGVTDGQGGFGYLIYVRPQDYEQALRVLEA
jgi:hypothetical protein